jgi:hypothetical protein
MNRFSGRGNLLLWLCKRRNNSPTMSRGQQPSPVPPDKIRGSKKNARVLCVCVCTGDDIPIFDFKALFDFSPHAFLQISFVISSCPFFFKFSNAPASPRRERLNEIDGRKNKLNSFTFWYLERVVVLLCHFLKKRKKECRHQKKSKMSKRIRERERN